MISTLLTVAFSLTSLTHAYTIPNAKRDAVLRLPVSATPANFSDVLSATKRQTVGSLQNVQTGTRYLIEFSIGSPAQSVSIALDTGSSETWVDPVCSTAGSANEALCNSLPVYNPSTSTSAQDLGTQNTLSYGKGSADIEYWTDDFLIGGASVKAQQFGVASTSSDMPTGLMGVGPGIELVGYDTIIDQLALQGVTQSRAFSLDLRSVDSPDGAIIFGGIDTMKYTGALEKCPIIPAAESPDDFDRYWIQMDSVGITKPGEAPKTYTPSSTPVFLDSGGTLSRLPTTIFNSIIADFPGATEDGTSGLYTVDCSTTTQAGTVDFTFGNTIIHVPYLEFIWQISGTCYIGLAADDSAPVLGDSFLRAAFVVYDQDNQNVLLANAASCGTNLVAIGKGADAVPSVTGGCGAASSTSSSISSSSTSIIASSSSDSSVQSLTTAASSTSTAAASSTQSASDSSAPSSSSVVSTTSSSITSDLPASSSSSYPSSTSSFDTTTASLAAPSSSSSSSVSFFTLLPSSSSDSSLPSSTDSTSYAAASSSSTSIPLFTLLPSSTAATSSMDSGAYPTSSPASVTQYSTSTVYATSVYTITSCAATVTDCPARIGQVTTDIISLYTTICPVTETEATPTPTPTPTAWSISTVYATTTYTISSCAPTVVNCPYGAKTTETISLYTTLCPVTEEASSIPETSYTTMTNVKTVKSTTTVTAPETTATSKSHRTTYTVPLVVSSAPPAISTSTLPGTTHTLPVSIPSKAVTNSTLVLPTTSSTAAGVASATASASPTHQQFTGGVGRLQTGNLFLGGLAIAGLLLML